MGGWGRGPKRSWIFQFRVFLKSDQQSVFLQGVRVVAFLLFAPGKPLLIPGRIQSHRPCSQQLTGRHHLLVSPGPLRPPRGSARQPPPRAPAPSPASIFLGRSLVSCKRGQGGPRAGKRRGPASGSRTSDAAALSPQTAPHRQGQVGAKE